MGPDFTEKSQFNPPEIKKLCNFALHLENPEFYHEFHQSLK